MLFKSAILNSFALYMLPLFRYKVKICTLGIMYHLGSGQMQPERKAGISIVFGIPAIVGAGLVWQLSGNWQVVFGYLGLLGFILAALLANPEQMISSENKTEH
jgi:hypothetical protein